MVVYKLVMRSGKSRACFTDSERDAITEAEEVCAATGEVVTLHRNLTPIGEVSPHRNGMTLPGCFRRF